MVDEMGRVVVVPCDLMFRNVLARVILRGGGMIEERRHVTRARSVLTSGEHLLGVCVSLAHFPFPAFQLLLFIAAFRLRINSLVTTARQAARQARQPPHQDFPSKKSMRETQSSRKRYMM